MLLHANAKLGLATPRSSRPGRTNQSDTQKPAHYLLAAQITRRLIEDFVQRPPRNAGPPPALAELTKRELEVLQLIARGRSNAEIGRELFLSEATVKTHVTRLLAKLAVRDRVQAVIVVRVRPHPPRRGAGRKNGSSMRVD